MATSKRHPTETDQQYKARLSHMARTEKRRLSGFMHWDSHNQGQLRKEFLNLPAHPLLTKRRNRLSTTIRQLL